MPEQEMANFLADKELMRQNYLSGIKRPRSYDLKFLRSWFERPKMGDFPLRGPDQDAWSPDKTYDLLAIQRRESSDNCFSKRFKQPLPEDPESEICQYSEGHLATVVNIFGTVLSSILPITSIVVLYFVTDTSVRLGLSVAFTAMFSCCLALVSRARRVEIFAASSAYVRPTTGLRQT
jgi:hypothetical protein